MPKTPTKYNNCKKTGKYGSQKLCSHCNRWLPRSTCYRHLKHEYSTHRQSQLPNYTEVTNVADNNNIQEVVKNMEEITIESEDQLLNDINMQYEEYQYPDPEDIANPPSESIDNRDMAIHSAAIHSAEDDELHDDFDDCNDNDFTELGKIDMEEIRDAIEMLYWKLENNITDRAYDRLPPNKKPSLSLYKIKHWLNLHSGVTMVQHDCCINSCVAFTGPLRSYNSCPHCSEPRYDERQKTRKSFIYVPLISRFIVQYRNKKRSKELQYRAEYSAIKRSAGKEERTYSDIFDGHHYLELIEQGLFSDVRDIALGLSTDGFQLFQDNHHDCWPILIINYNIAPQHHVEKT
jgi:hypothetical protein